MLLDYNKDSFTTKFIKMVRGDRQATKYRNLLNESINKSDIVGIFDVVFTIGVEEMTSGIHFIPSESSGMIVIMKEGFPDELVQYPISLHNQMISKVKIEFGQMNPNVNDIVQEVRVSIITKTYKKANLGLKIVPISSGEELVVHIINEPNS